VGQQLEEGLLVKEQQVDSETSYLEVEDAFNRFHALAKKLARQQVARSSDTSKSNREEFDQLASVGLLEAIRKYGYNVTPLQVQSFIKDQFRSHIQAEIKASPWRRKTCPVCGSSAARECEHKKQLRLSADQEPEEVKWTGRKDRDGNEFVKNDGVEINLDWVAGKTADGDEFTYHDVIADDSDSFATEREQNLEQQRAILDKVLGKIPRTYREVITLRRDGKTWDEIAEATGHARSTVITHYNRAIKSLQRIIAQPKTRYATGINRIPRLCTMFPFYRPGQRIPWSQDSKFSLSIIPGYRGRTAEEHQIILAEQQDHCRYMTVEEAEEYDQQKEGQIQ
jgi:RNA polymerase sigma factor (sigma-70 family)